MNIAAICIGIVMVLTGIFGLSFFGYEMQKFFAPRQAAIDNSVFHESAQYNDGMVRDLENLEMQYRAASEAEKLALKATILHRFSVYPVSKMSPSLRNFYEEMKQ